MIKRVCLVVLLAVCMLPSGVRSQEALQVTVLEPLVCKAAASPASGPLPLAVSFSAQATGGEPPYMFAWVFGDGRTSNEQNPAHTYTEAGSYRVVLWVRDARSITCSKTLTIVPY